jgi:hypothetical protein
VSTSLRNRIRRTLLLGCVSGAAVLVLAVAEASAATYPGGGSSFSGSTEGWTITAGCPSTPLVLLCSASGSYDQTAGNPSGSLADKTEITLNVLGVFSSEAVETSPTFTVAESGAGTLALERRFADAELLSLAPVVEYSANLVDKTNGNKQKAFSETVEKEGALTFGPKQGPVALVAGHSYAIEIVAVTKSTVGVGLLGSATFWIDNVSVTGPAGSPGSPGGGPGGGGNGANGGEGGEGANGANGGAGGVSSARLESLIRSSSLIGPAVLKGNRLTVKAGCPKKVGTTCTLTLQGQLTRKKAATTARRARVKEGKRKQFALKVKPASLAKVKAKKKLLFKETVRAGKARATVWKSIKLVRK